jgi:hypothetical protein
MERRNFIRVMGGGVIMAASAGLVGCSQKMPEGAIEAWKGPGPETDLRRWVLGYAILAPHSHNLQSWLVDLSTPDEILLRCDLNRVLPETDPFSRQIMMSHGTFLELLDIAASERGLRAEITLFPEGTFGPERLDQRPVARVRLASDPAIQKDPLFAQILKRHTTVACTTSTGRCLRMHGERWPTRCGRICCASDSPARTNLTTWRNNEPLPAKPGASS